MLLLLGKAGRTLDTICIVRTRTLLNGASGSFVRVRTTEISMKRNDKNLNHKFTCNVTLNLPLRCTYILTFSTYNITLR